MAVNNIKEYDLDEYLDRVSYSDNNEVYINAYNKFIQARAIDNNGVSFRDAEKRILGLDRYSSTDAIIKTIEGYYNETYENAEITYGLDKLMKSIDSISKSEASHATQIHQIRYEVAEFGIQNDLDCYLFDANVEVFDDYYNRLMISKGRGR